MGIQSVWETFPREKYSYYYYSPSLRSARSVIQLLVKPCWSCGKICWLSPAVTLRGPHFSGRLLVETQRVMKLYGLGKRAGIPQLKHIAGTPHLMC